MGNHRANEKRFDVIRPLTLAEKGESVYGVVSKELGKCQFLVKCSDDVERLCSLRGKMRKKVRVCPMDVVLVIIGESIKQGYIYLKYTNDEVKKLKENGYFTGLDETVKEADVDFEHL